MNAENDGRAAAMRFREEHGLGVQPLGDLPAIIERATGVDVAIVDGEADEHGLTVHDPVRGATFVGVARSSHPMRQRSTLAHELCHVVFHDWDDQSDIAERSPREVRADAFARHLLVPSEGLRQFLGNSAHLTTEDLSAVVQWFLVSPAMAAIALHDNGYIGSTTKGEWLRLSAPRLATRFGWSDQYQALASDAGRSRAPQRLLARAVTGYAEGVVGAQVIASLRGVDVDAAIRELADAGIEPPALDDGRDDDPLPALEVDLDGLDADPEHPVG